MARLWLGLVLVAVLAYATLTGAGQGWLDVQLFFFMDYVAVRDQLKGGQGLREALVDVNNADSHGVLAMFWMQRAFDACQATQGPGQTVYDVLQETAPCRHRYFFTHWDELNHMIRTQAQFLQKRGIR
jgi:hypothetical protein